MMGELAQGEELVFGSVCCRFEYLSNFPIDPGRCSYIRHGVEHLLCWSCVQKTAGAGESPYVHDAFVNLFGPTTS